jgi:hypothetical protein
MKNVLIFALLLFLLFSCNKKNDSTTSTTTPPVITPTVTPTSAFKPLSVVDSITAVNIHQEYASMSACLDSMLATPHHTLQLLGIACIIITIHCFGITIWNTTMILQPMTITIMDGHTTIQRLTIHIITTIYTLIMDMSMILC